MKNLYGKGKVKVKVQVQVHPSSCRDAYSVLRLLPVAIATLSAALPPEDQEVLAYLIARAPDGLPLEDETKKNKRGTPGRKSNGNGNEGTPPWGGGGGGGRGATASSSSCSSSSPFARFAEADALLRRSPSTGRAGAATPTKDGKNKRKSVAAAAAQQQQQVLRSHEPSFECSCFQCYTSYWSRWDASPSREKIHEAIDLFEEHMAAVAAEAEAEAYAKANSKGKNRKGGSKEGKNGHIKARAEENIPKLQEVRVAVPDEMEGKIETNVVIRSEREEDSKLAPKSKKIVPFDFGEDEDVERGAKKAAASEHEQQQQQEARAGACPLGSRSLMRRMFPDMMSFVADHLWTAWSSPARATNT